MTPQRIETLRAVLDRREPDLSVITDYVHKGRKFTVIVRTADTVGIADVHCVIGDMDYRSFRGTALGSHRWVKLERHCSVEIPAAALKAKGFQRVVAQLPEQAVDCQQEDNTRPTGLFCGLKSRASVSVAAILPATMSPS